MLYWIVGTAVLIGVLWAISAMSRVSQEQVDQYLKDSGNGAKIEERKRRQAERERRRRRDDPAD